MYLLWMLASLFLSFSLQGEPVKPSTPSTTLITQVKHIASIETDEILLSNGMRVLLKQIDGDDDEVYIRMTAKGGYSTLPLGQRASGQLAAEIGWESGLGNLSIDQLSVRLYENSIDFNPEIQAFSRFIEGSCDTQGIEAFLQLINMLFTQQKFTKDAYDRVIKQTRESIRKAHIDRMNTFENAFRMLNSQNNPMLSELSDADLAKIDFAAAREFYQRCFENPADFVCVIVGRFERKMLDIWLAKYLGTIPKQHTLKPFPAPGKISFPPGVTKKTASNQQRTECLTRVAFPLNLSLTGENIHLFELTCQVIEIHLKTLLRVNLDETLGLDVAYEFPLFPYLESTWLLIQYRCNHSRADAITGMLLKSLETLLANGPIEDELIQARSQMKITQEFWIKQSSYWVATLTNYSLWNWSLLGILADFDDTQTFSLQAVSEMIKNNLSLKDYTVISTMPL